MMNIEDAEGFIKKINAGIKLNKWIYWGTCLKDNPGFGTICLWNFSDHITIAENGNEFYLPGHSKY